jgi:FkbM family methyltransferase
VTPYIEYTADEIRNELMRHSVHNYDIAMFHTAYKALKPYTSNQYFDMFLPDEDEIFIDCGSYDGQSSLNFVNWCRGNYKAIIAFECDHGNFELTKFHLRNQKCCEVINCALSYEPGFIDIGLNDGFGKPSFSLISNDYSKTEDSVQIATNSIDNVLHGEKATFIKMDIEGYELNAIMGARETIAKYKPRLAISIYHKPQDIIEIPKILMEFRNDYIFALRHYFPGTPETVLYAR